MNLMNFFSFLCFENHQLHESNVISSIYLEPYLCLVTVIEEACLVLSEPSPLDGFVINLGHLLKSDNFPTPPLLTQLLIYIGN